MIQLVSHKLFMDSTLVLLILNVKIRAYNSVILMSFYYYLKFKNPMKIGTEIWYYQI